MIRKIKKRDGKIDDFNPFRITNAIWKAAQAVGGKDHRRATELTEKVLETIEKELKPGQIPTVEQVQDTVEKVLIEEGHAKTAKAYILYRHQHHDIREIGGLLKDIDVVDGYLSMMDWKVNENSNMSYSLQGLNVYATENIISHYWLNKIYPPEIGEAHSKGDFHVHDLGTLGAYTYYGRETVIAKISGAIQIISFQDLYEKLNLYEKLLSKKDDAHAKYPDDVQVLDKNGWTNVTRVVKKAKNKSMHFIKNEGGRSVIVTEDHPMVLGSEVFKQAKQINKTTDKLLTVDVKDLLKNESLFFKKEINIAEELIRNGITDFCVEGITYEEFLTYNNTIPDNAIISMSSNPYDLLNTLRLTEDLGYFVGFYIVKGSIKPHQVSIKQNDTPKNKPIIDRLKKAAYELGCRPSIKSEDGHTTLQITNSTFSNYVIDTIFDLKDKSKEKRLPADILQYNKEFVQGAIAGIIDADESINTAQTSIILKNTSRSLLEQISIVLNLQGFTVQDQNLERVGSTQTHNQRLLMKHYPLYGISIGPLEHLIPSVKCQSACLSKKSCQVEGSSWQKVLSNQQTEILDEYIYDITTESHTLVVNGMWNHNCVGWDLQDILMKGFKGVSGKIESKPAKHFGTALMQIVNYLYTLQGEAAGAQALSNFDTLLAPFIRYDGLNYKQVKQEMQKFMYNMNVPTRVGFQSPFTNITLDLTVPSYMKEEPVIIGGELQDTLYNEYQKEMDMINQAFAEIMIEGDAHGRPFTFPIPTYNITKDFDWENEKLKSLWEMTAKYGIPYFSNFINSDMSPEDARSMCCRLRLDNRELKKRGGGLFGANPKTGSIGVVTINLPRIGYLSRDEKDFFKRLDDMMDLAKQSLIIKREVIENLTESGLHPYSRYYLADIKKAYEQFWKNHFSTIGIIGMNDALLNFMNKSIGDPEGEKFAEKVMDHMRDRISDYQEETGSIFNLEATPAEGASYRMARIDKKTYPDIRIYNQENYRKKGDRDVEPYYTNSTQLPVGFTTDVFKALDLQDGLQTRYTGGTVLHIFLGEDEPNPKAVKQLVKKVADNYELPYYTITPTFSVCPGHGYIPGEHEFCPECEKQGETTVCEVYSRVVGYLRPVNQWNKGKQREFTDRKTFTPFEQSKKKSNKKKMLASA